ncbi:MAG: DegV family protein [Gemmatimonadales bacterium]|nr:DegV family EDD domain-containing protein [Gemmatimonadota bacterium]MCC7131702.1 DegV family EDD domain-containing protein [Gemmatimonadales bacterium]MDX2057006.1 DegV family protein [Gemmatimonadales bacterium]
MGIGIAYVDGPRLARSMYAAADWVQAGRDEINRLNVFPVPDGDTGTNFSLTLRAVADALQALGDAPLGETARTAARAAVLGARGNSGMMLAHFLLGFADAIGDRPTADAPAVAQAIRRGADTLYASLDEPREGTILTVARDAAEAAERAAAETRDFGAFMRRMLAEGEAALARTPTLLAVLREAGVVDAGGKGFVRMLEGVVRLIRGDPILPAAPSTGTTGEHSAAADFTVAAERDYQFCTECLIRGEQLPSSNEVRLALHQFGGSVVVAQVGDILKLHVHTDTPEAVFALGERWGTVTFRKADDMRAQHRALSHATRRPVAIVVDSSADLADSILDRHRIAMVPLQVTFGDTTYQDRLGLKPEEFYRLLRATRQLPTTSQPTPGDFVRVFRSATVEADEVVAVLLSSGVSGTFQAGQAAVKAGNLTNVHLVDSRSASLGLGMLALRAVELAESGWGAKAIVTELERIRARSGLFLTVDTYENLLRSGRVSRGKAWLAGMLDVKPILSLDGAGRIIPVDRVRGRESLVARVLQLVDRALTPRPKALRFGIVHAEAPEVAERLRTALVAAYRPRDCFVALATGVLGTHAGVGAWAVFYQVEDSSEG